jgi:hypothetical protein
MVKGIYLTLLVGPTVPVPVPQIVLDALTSVEVNSEDGRPSGFQLSFTLSNNSPLHTLFLLASGQQLTQIRVILVVTLNGIPDVLMDGVVTNQQVAPGGDAGHSILTVTGEDLTALMNDEDRSGEKYPGMSAEARVAKILLRYVQYGIVPVVIPTFVVDVPIPTKRIPAQRGTDLEYVRQLADKVGHVFFIEPGPAPGANVAYWGPKFKISPPQPALSINMDAHTNVESLSFTFDGRERTLPILRIQEERSRKFIDIPVPDTTLLEPPLGAIPPLKVKTEIVQAGRLTMTEAMLLALAKASASTDSVTGQGSLDVLRYGQVLKARRLVGVRGAGIAFDGLHYVSKVTHSIKPGSYTQQFTVTRNGLLPTVPAVPT